jgi:hypothetical protein
VLLPLLARVTVILLGICCALAALTPLGAIGNPLVEGFDQACDTPCFLGIQPGATRIEAARAALETHPWVTQVAARMTMDYFGYEHLRFAWQPTGAEGPWAGELVSSYGVVYSVRLESDLRLADVWAAFGQPPMVGLSASAVNADQVRLYNTFLADSSLSAMAVLECPLSVRGVLESAVQALELRRRDIFTPLPDVARTPGRLVRALRTQARAVC